MASRPPMAAITDSWLFSWTSASARRSASKSPTKCSMSTHTVGIGPPAPAASRSSGSRAANRPSPAPRSSMASKPSRCACSHLAVTVSPCRYCSCTASRTGCLISQHLAPARHLRIPPYSTRSPPESQPGLPPTTVPRLVVQVASVPSLPDARCSSRFRAEVQDDLQQVGGRVVQELVRLGRPLGGQHVGDQGQRVQPAAGAQLHHRRVQPLAGAGPPGHRGGPPPLRGGPPG